jgi:hypothetical protein
MNPIPLADESRLAALVSNPIAMSCRWEERAACAHLSPDIDAYFPDDGELPPAEAMALCRSCPVAAECLATALVHESQDSYRFGWWGGVGPDKRQQIAKRLGIQTLPAELDIREPADLARYLRSHEHTITSIAALLGCTERTVYRYLADPAA